LLIPKLFTFKTPHILKLPEPHFCFRKLFDGLIFAFFSRYLVLVRSNNIF